MKVVLKFLFLSLCILIRSDISYAEDTQSLFDLPLEWRDQANRVVSLSTWKGKSVVLTMAYTRCKSACPITFGRLKDIERDLEKEKKRAEFVVVSFDPMRDTPEQLAHFKEMHDLHGEHWHLLNGTAAAVRELSVALGISYQEDLKTEEFSHSNKIILLDGRGKIALEVEGLASDTSPIVAGVSR